MVLGVLLQLCLNEYFCTLRTFQNCSLMTAKPRAYRVGWQQECMSTSKEGLKLVVGRWRSDGIERHGLSISKVPIREHWQNTRDYVPS